MVERELQDGLLERGYDDDVLPRDRKMSDGFVHAGPAAQNHAGEPAQTQWAEQARRAGAARLQHAATNPPPNRAGPNGRPHPQPNGGSGHNSGAGRGAGARHRRREYDLDGELFDRGFEIDELD